MLAKIFLPRLSFYRGGEKEDSPTVARLRSELGPRAEFVWLLFWRRCGGCARRGELLGARSAGAAGAVRVCAAEVWAIGGGQGLRTLCSSPEREKHRAGLAVERATRDAPGAR